MSSILDQLIKYYEEEPNDPFNAYALALEYSKNDLPKAINLVEINIQRFPSYLPNYYHLAKWYESEQNFAMAIDTYRRGIELANIQKNLKTARELQSALNLLLDDF
jgi:tetratricopeptide (TPR) repeat protein